MVHHYEDFSKGEMMVDETVSLDEEETKQLLSAIKDNEFWTIPPVHPDERLGLDGTTVFIEGYYNKSHLIRSGSQSQNIVYFKFIKRLRSLVKL